MKKEEDKFPWNLIVNKILHSFEDMMLEANFCELQKKEKIIVLRSAKEEVMNKFLERLYSINYIGKIYLIGRQGDEKYISEFPKMNIDLYIVEEEKKYSIEDTKAYIDIVCADAVCFLYSQKLSASHDNLFQIVKYASCDSYAISKQFEIVKFDLTKLHHYLLGKQVYDAFCDWFYEARG